MNTLHHHNSSLPRSSASPVLQNSQKTECVHPKVAHTISFLVCLVRRLSREQDKNQTLPIKKKERKKIKTNNKTPHSPRNTKYTQICLCWFEKYIYRWRLKVTYPSLPFLTYLEAQKQAIVRKTAGKRDTWYGGFRVLSPPD